MRSAVLIPARNEAPRLGGTLQRLAEVLPDCPVFVVDGDSHDATAEVARRHGAQVLPRPGAGYAGALRVGYARIFEEGFDALVQLDADGQHPPEAAPVLLAALEGANWVVGSREGTGTPGALPRRVANGVLAFAVRLATGIALRDVTSGFQALDRKAMEAFLQHMPEDVADANLRVLAARLGLLQREVPVRMDIRPSGRSMHDGLSGVVNLGRSLRGVARALAVPQE